MTVSLPASAFLPLPASAEQLPGSPSDLELPDSYHDLAPAEAIQAVGRKLAWTLLALLREHGQWAAINASALALEAVLVNRRRDRALPPGNLFVGSDERVLVDFKAASRELADLGFIARGEGNTVIWPTPKLARLA